MNKDLGITSSKLQIILIHILVWVFYILYESSLLFYIQPESIYWLEIMASFALNAGVFYVNVGWILPKFGRAKKYWMLAPALISLIGLYIFLCFLESRYLVPVIESKAAPSDGITKIFMAQHIYRAVYFIGLSFGYWFALRSVRSEVKLREAEREQYLELLNQQKLKKEIAVSKLAMYRSQLNPHFLFNTLNFFYSSIYPFSKELAESMILLSNLIRYISEQSIESNLVDLKGEIELIENYVKLNQLRYDNNLKIKFEVLGIGEHKKIAPFIMINLVENAFKYGELMDEKRPLIIRLKIMATKLELYIENMIRSDHKPVSTGVGLSNLRKQLDLIYADNYSLTTTEIEHKFKCCLKLNL